LSHILKLSWPAPPSPLFKKLEEEAALGETFHLFVHRIIQGLNPEESAFETEIKPLQNGSIISCGITRYRKTLFFIRRGS
jgi:hypothetical protein